MNRMHIHVGVEDLNQSIKFYSALFGTEPAKVKEDYAKWMVEDPRINFAISTRSGKKGLNHLGLQVDESSELAAIRTRLKNADMSLFDEGETVCCYAKSEKSWVEDPAGIAWEAYQTMADAQLFSQSEAAETEVESTSLEQSGGACCAPAAKTSAPKAEASCCAPALKTSAPKAETSCCAPAPKQKSSCC